MHLVLHNWRDEDDPNLEAWRPIYETGLAVVLDWAAVPKEIIHEDKLGFPEPNHYASSMGLGVAAAVKELAPNLKQRLFDNVPLLPADFEPPSAHMQTIQLRNDDIWIILNTAYQFGQDDLRLMQGGVGPTIAHKMAAAALSDGKSIPECLMLAYKMRMFHEVGHVLDFWAHDMLSRKMVEQLETTVMDRPIDIAVWLGANISFYASTNPAEGAGEVLSLILAGLPVPEPLAGFVGIVKDFITSL